MTARQPLPIREMSIHVARDASVGLRAGLASWRSADAGDAARNRRGVRWLCSRSSSGLPRGGGVGDVSE